MTTESNEEQITTSSSAMTVEEIVASLAVTPIQPLTRDQLDHMVDAALTILRNEPPLPPLMTDAELAEPQAETEEEEKLPEVDAFIERLKKEDHTDLIAEFDNLDGDLRQEIFDEAEALFNIGDLEKGYLIAYYMVNYRNYFDGDSLHRLRALWSRFEDADDWPDIKEMLENDYSVVYCDDCGEPEFSDETRRTYTDDVVCRECISNNYCWSEYYDCYISEDSSRWALDENGCEVLIHENDFDFRWNEEADQYTHREYEYEPPEPEIIGNYHSSKSLARMRHDDWTKQHKRFFGVELEVEVKSDGYSRGDVAQRIHNLVNDGEFHKNIFIERDGSLSNGFEMITHPMSLPAHRELWSFLQDKEAIKGLRSHNTTTCGLHVHVSRNGLSSLQIAKIVTFVNSPCNEQIIRAVARRYADGYCKIKSKGIGESAKSNDRYEAVNITPGKTIEFRIFKGSLKYESVVSAIEFSHALTEFCKPSVTSIKDLTTEKFLDFCAKELPEETKIMRPYIAARIEND